MDHEPRVQVVLGEADRSDGLLRFVLEAEGFDLVGLASNDEELARVLRGARPSVVVLDGGISAVAALDARTFADGAALVVVWPDGVSAGIAAERVEPSMVIEDLGDAVRRAASLVVRREEPIRVAKAVNPAPVTVAASLAVERIERSAARRRKTRRAQLLVAAATWLLIITALSAIATAVPNALDLFSTPSRERPSASPSAERRAVEGSTGSETTGDGEPVGQAQPNGCEDAARANGGGGSGDPAPAQGCPPVRERDAGRKTAGVEGRNADEPGADPGGGEVGLDAGGAEVGLDAGGADVEADAGGGQVDVVAGGTEVDADVGAAEVDADVGGGQVDVVAGGEVGLGDESD
ncbi:MAG: hypothetical protein ACRDG8_04705 [Actinomycetota bacterium]